MPAIRRHRRETLLLGWLKELPDATVRRSPVLSVFYGYLLMVSGDLDAVGERFDDAERALAAGPDPALPWADTDDLRTLPATIAVHRAAIAQAHGDVAGTVAQATRALALAGPQDHLARGGAAGFLGLAAWAKGDVGTAFDTFTAAVASLHAAGNTVDELTSTVVLADLLIAAGRPAEARGLYERALELAEAHGEPVARATATLLVGLSEMDCRRRGPRRRHAPPRRCRLSGRTGADDREPPPVVRGQGSRGRGGWRPVRGGGAPDPGGGGLPSGVLPRRPSHRGDQGSGVDRGRRPSAGGSLGGGARRDHR